MGNLVSFSKPKSGATNFHQLSAFDIDKQDVKFSSLDGKVKFNLFVVARLAKQSQTAWCLMLTSSLRKVMMPNVSCFFPEQVVLVVNVASK